MTTQFIELETINEDDLKTVQGGGFLGGVIDTSANFLPAFGAMNTVARFTGAPTLGDVIEPIFT